MSMSIAQRLARIHPELSAEQLEEIVRRRTAAAAALEIQDEDDVMRFVDLEFRITAEQRRSPLIVGTLRRILGNVDWEPAKRLDFVYKHLVGRSVSPTEPTLEPWFVPETPNV